jgi:hypothetical protein
MRILTAAVCASLMSHAVHAQPAPDGRATRLIVFSEPGFPALDVAPPQPVPGALETTSTTALADALASPGVLIWRHGSAFPAESWGSLTAFLERGGSFLYLGGEPFTRPVVGPPGARVAQPRTVSWLKALRLNQAYRVGAAGATVVPAPGSPISSGDRSCGASASVVILEPRLSETKDFADEDGSPGARDGIVRPLFHVTGGGDNRRFPFAAAAMAIDRLQGAWAGGRWVFWLLSEPPNETERALLFREASAPALDFRVDPVYGTFHDGEQPAVTLRLHRPRATAAAPFSVRLTVEGPAGPVTTVATTLDAATHGSRLIALPGRWAPGLYRVRAEAEGLPPARTGFWIFDPALFLSGDALTFDAYTLRRNGRPEPVVGTTLMSATVHRDFLFEPDAATWDQTFAELASIDVNMVRTGVWSGWKKFALEPEALDEAFLRALEAYYLTARRHGIAVMFTFFAFAPESFGGVSPYFDPRSIEGQRAYVSAVAGRFAHAKEMLWDFINEPSFSSPRKLWRTRPNGDRYERAAFLEWLEQRYSPAARPGETWEDVVRARWRLLPSDAIDLPPDEEFDDRYLMGSARPYRAVDYTLFAQDAFARWAQQMTDAVRGAGSKAAVTVGQDEGGLTTRPSPLLHHPGIAFTSMHTWWNNDALLWDGVLAKASGKPLLVSETGIMQRELLSGEAVRTPGNFARQLSRKFGYAFAAGAFGVIQWCYDVNPYMASDNEVAIGLRRVDGSYKPEHGILREFARFVSAHRDKFDGYVEPDVVLIVPSAEMFSPRDTATGATRVAVRTLYERLGIPARAVAEYRAAEDLGSPKAIVLPATRGLSSAAWSAIEAAVNRGARLIASGWFETDDAGLPATRLGVDRRPLSAAEGNLRFGGTLPESWFAAAGDGQPAVITRGAGAIHHHPLPLEWADRTDAAEAHYRAALAAAGVTPVAFIDGRIPEGCTIRILPMAESLLIVGINESSTAQTVRVRQGARRVEVVMPAGMTEMMLVNRTSGAIQRLHTAAMP